MHKKWLTWTRMTLDIFTFLVILGGDNMIRNRVVQKLDVVEREVALATVDFALPRTGHVHLRY